MHILKRFFFLVLLRFAVTELYQVVTLILEGNLGRRIAMDFHLYGLIY